MELTVRRGDREKLIKINLLNQYKILVLKWAKKKVFGAMRGILPLREVNWRNRWGKLGETKIPIRMGPHYLQGLMKGCGIPTLNLSSGISWVTYSDRRYIYLFSFFGGRETREGNCFHVRVAVGEKDLDALPVFWEKSDMNTINIFSENFQWKKKNCILGALFPSVGSKPLINSEEVFCVWCGHLTNSALGWQKDQVSWGAFDGVPRKSLYLSRLA